MALLNRLFPNKKKNQKQGYVSFGKNESLSWKPFNFTKEQVRVLLFRECDMRGRKLLFDSNAVLKIPLDNSRTSKHKYCSRSKCDTFKKTEPYIEMTNGFGYQYIKPNNDVTLFGDMVFGSVAMMFRGMTLKVHSMKSPHRLMCTRVFYMPLTNSHCKRRSDQSIEDSCGSSISSVSDYAFSQVPQSDIKQGFNYESGPLDVPNSGRIGKAAFGSLECDSDYCGDASLHSMSSIGSGGCWQLCPGGTDSLNASMSFLSNSSNSGSSLASIQRRWIRNISTSLERGNLNTPWCFVKTRTSSGRSSSDEGFGGNQRKIQLGLTVVINMSPQEEKDMEIFFFEHMAVMEYMMERLHHNVEKAYCKKDMFVHLMVEASAEIQQWLYDLFTAPRLPSPLWMNLSSPSDNYQGCSHSYYTISSVFLRDLCHLITAIDTKATNFFVSTLVTAVLTHHLGWVATILPIKAPPSSITKQPYTGHMLDALAKSHPYNALWAQLGDLHGALGNPVKIARTIVTANGKKNDLLNKLLSILSYFIRCGNIEKKIDRLNASEDENGMIDAVIEKLSSQNVESATSFSSLQSQNSQEYLPASASVVTSPSVNKISLPENSVESVPCVHHTRTIHITKLFDHDNCSGITSAFSTGKYHEMSNLCLNNTQCEQKDTCNEVTKLKTSPTYSKESLVNNSEVPLKSEQKCDNSLTLKKSPRVFNKLHGSPTIKVQEQDEVHPEFISNDLNVKDKKEFGSFLHPDLISEKVNRLCRVPVNAVLYHINGDVQNNSYINYFPKKTDCEKQLSSISAKELRHPPYKTEDSEYYKENLPTKSYNKPNRNCNEDSVIFVLGENETLIDLKSQNGSNIHKSKSDNILCEENVNVKAYGTKKTNCYSPEVVHSDQKTFGKNTSLAALPVENRNNLTSRITNCKDIPVCDKLNSKIMRANINENQTCIEKLNIQEETKDIVGEKNLLNHFPGCKENVGNIRENNFNNSLRIVTSHSAVIELEENGNTEINMIDNKERSYKSIVRSQSLSLPIRRNVPKRKTGHICRRNSDYFHENNKFLKDYSTQFNFECCNVLDDYVDRVSIDKSPLSEKKSQKLGGTRENFESQNVCENYVNEQTVYDSVVCKESLCSCAKNSENCRLVNPSVKTELNEKEECVHFGENERYSVDKMLDPANSQDSTTVEHHKNQGKQSILLNLPLPSNGLPQEQTCGFAASMFGGVVDHYVPDLILHGCTQDISNWEATLKQDLTSAAYHSILDQDISEAVCIVGNADVWEVQLVSSHGSFVDKPGAFGVRVGMSQLVANMLESLSHLWKLRTPPEQCLRHLESKLRELCLRSQALAELLLTTDFCDMATVTSSLGLEANDVPLLLAIASVHTPQVTCHYGLSFR